MKMPEYLKKLNGNSLLVGFIIGLIFAGGINAVYAANEPPCPIGLVINTVPTSANMGLRIQLTDAGTVIMDENTNEYGELTFELGGVAVCKAYIATILDCADNPICVRTVAFNPAGPTIWDITGWVPPVTTTTTTTTEVTTTTTTEVPTTTTTTIPTCPTQDYSLWSGAVVVIVAILGAIISKYAPYKGKAKTGSYIKKDGSRGFRVYVYEQYTTKAGNLSAHWVKKKEW